MGRPSEIKPGWVYHCLYAEPQDERWSVKVGHTMRPEGSGDAYRDQRLLQHIDIGADANTFLLCEVKDMLGVENYIVRQIRRTGAIYDGVIRTAPWAGPPKEQFWWTPQVRDALALAKQVLRQFGVTPVWIPWRYKPRPGEPAKQLVLDL